MRANSRALCSGTYGRLLCDDLGANCTVSAISGKGIFHNCCDNNETMNVIGLRKLYVSCHLYIRYLRALRVLRGQYGAAI